MTLRLTSFEVSAALETFKDRSSLVWGGERIDCGSKEKKKIYKKLHLNPYLGVEPCQEGSEVEPRKFNSILRLM